VNNIIEYNKENNNDNNLFREYSENKKDFDYFLNNKSRIQQYISNVDQNPSSKNTSIVNKSKKSNHHKNITYNTNILDRNNELANLIEQNKIRNKELNNLRNKVKNVRMSDRNKSDPRIINS